MGFYIGYASNMILWNEECFQLHDRSAADKEMKTKTNTKY